MSYTVYILRSELNGRYYVGSTEDVTKRVEFHNGPKARWTKRYQPWRLIHSEEYLTRKEAVRRERFLKSIKNIERNLEEIMKRKK